MRTIDKIIIHCSASDNPKHDNIKTLYKWHVEENGWKDIGYHYVITKDGCVHQGRDIHEPGAHCKGMNESSIGICLTGDLQFSEAQFDSLRKVVHQLRVHLGIAKTMVFGHRDFCDYKTCPNFDVKEVLNEGSRFSVTIN